MYFVLLRKPTAYEQVKEACLKYGDNQKKFRGRQKERTAYETGIFKTELKSLQELEKKTSEKIDSFCKKFENLELMVSE